MFFWVVFAQWAFVKDFGTFQVEKSLQKEMSTKNRHWNGSRDLHSIGSMYDIITYIWQISMVNVGEYIVCICK